MEANLVDFMIQMMALVTAGGFGYFVYKLNNDGSGKGTE